MLALGSAVAGRVEAWSFRQVEGRNMDGSFDFVTLTDGTYGRRLPVLTVFLDLKIRFRAGD